MTNKKSINRWKLILGNSANNDIFDAYDSMTKEDKLINKTLDILYDNNIDNIINSNPIDNNIFENNSSSKNVSKITEYIVAIKELFPKEIHSTLQKDLLHIYGKDLLSDNEIIKNLEPNLEIASILINSIDMLSEKSKKTARKVINNAVEEIKFRLKNTLCNSIELCLVKTKNSVIPGINSVDYKKTILKNLKNYNLKLRKLIPEKIYFYETRKNVNKWTIIINIDISGSMADSMIYSAVTGAILSQIPSIETKIIAFDQNIYEFSLSNNKEIVDLLLSIKPNGGTNIKKSLEYSSRFIVNPHKTILILISDLFDENDENIFIRQLNNLKESGVIVICLPAITDNNNYNNLTYNIKAAKKIAFSGIICRPTNPQELPFLIEEAIRSKNI